MFTKGVLFINAMRHRSNPTPMPSQLPASILARKTPPNNFTFYTSHTSFVIRGIAELSVISEMDSYSSKLSNWDKVDCGLEPSKARGTINIYARDVKFIAFIH